ncbi:prepilin peptidase, partial [Candidatus Bathyarchaeota archaeon]|nr:prepilin peptidase [Candidatus Bathyarchaeota archaeon]
MSQPLPALDAARIMVALAMLGYGSYRDLKTREIHDIVWVAAGAAGLMLDGYEMFMGTLTLRDLLTSVGFMAAVGLVLGYLRLFGGADLLAFIALAVIHPRPPTHLYALWGWAPPFYPFTL